jgi:hypothetical protein
MARLVAIADCRTSCCRTTILHPLAGLAICYFALNKREECRANVYDHYSVSGDYAKLVSANAGVTAADIRALVTSVEAIGSDEPIFNPTTDDLDDVERLAEVVL